MLFWPVTDGARRPDRRGRADVGWLCEGFRVFALVLPPRGRSALLLVALSLIATTALGAVPRPYGYYVLNDAGNGRTAARGYATGLASSPAYLQDITGHAVFVPIAKILPSITTWGDFQWSWGYLDTLVGMAISHGKQFSIELETGVQNTGTHYLQSLPANFAATCGSDCAPLFDVWVGGAPPGTCTSSYVLLPWIPRVQQFWALAADSLASHLKNIGAYGSLTLVHVPGLSVYDEELRLPTGNPAPASTDTTTCPDGYKAYPWTIQDTDTSVWRAIGYSDAAVISGFGVIATAFAHAFPDRVLGLSLFPEGHSGRGFPNLTADTTGEVASQLVDEVSRIAPGRVQLQADDLDIGNTYQEVLDFAPTYNAAIGWQSNKHNGTGATCAGDTCGPDGFDAPYYRLLKAGAKANGHYVEVWSNDVLSYPTAFAEADSAGWYSLLSVPSSPPAVARLLFARPNPSRGTVVVRCALEPGASGAALAIYDALGRRVRSIALDSTAGPALRDVAWDGREDSGASAPDGLYYALLREGASTIGRAGFVLER